MAPSTTLPEDSLPNILTLKDDLLFDILSRTSPQDVSRFAVTSKASNSVATSDILWKRFLPSDYSKIVERSDSLRADYPKKMLCLRLCHDSIILDGGKLNFRYEKGSQKKCYMVSARELIFTWKESPPSLKWKPHASSRFSEVALFKSVYRLDIRGKINTEMLSPKTTYGAYLVYKLAQKSPVRIPANAVVRFVNHEADTDAEDRASSVHLQYYDEENRAPSPTRSSPVRRSDKWIELRLGEFYNDEGNDGDVEACLIDIMRCRSNLVVEGIEFRPETRST